MTRDQRLFKMVIKSDLKIVENNWNSESKTDRMMAAYHCQQAIEKTIKLKAELQGLDCLWGHDIR